MSAPSWASIPSRLAQRAGLAGRVIAIEPDPENFEGLQHHVTLNSVEERIPCIRNCRRDPGVARFKAGRSVESSVTEEEIDSIEVQMTTLDEVEAISRSISSRSTWKGTNST